MRNEILFRDINTGEEVKACRLVIECFNEFVAPGYDNEGVKEFLKYVNPNLMKERLTKDNFILVAIDSEVIIGMIEVRSNNHISLLYVKKQYHRRGLARRLIKLAIDKCRQVDSKIDEIDVNSSPYAVKIYERLGFIKTNTEQLSNGIRFIPMKLKLPSF